MKTFFKLVKINIGKFIASLNFGNKKGKKKNGLLTVIVITGILLLSFFAYAYAYGTVLAQAGCIEVILAIGVLGGGLMSFITSITSSQGYIFSSSDTDLLLSMPIKKRYVVLSKIVSLYFTTQFTSILIMIPFGTVYAIYAQPKLAFYLVLILVMLISDLAFVCLGTLIGFLVGLVISGRKNKSLLQTIITMILLFAFLILYYRFSSSIEVDMENEEALAILANSMIGLKDKVVTYIYPVRFAYLALMGDYINILWLVLISIIPLILLTLIIDYKYLEMLTLFNKSYRNANFKLGNQERVDAYKTLIKKDLRTIFSNPMIAMNTAIAPLMTAFMILVLNFSLGGGEEALNMSSPILYFCIFFSGMYTMGACLISLEGKQFEIIKSAPLTPRVILSSKLLFSFLMAAPFALLSSIIILFISDFNIYYTLISLISMLGMYYFTSCVGLIVNVKRPQFNWDNPIKVVKQSASVLISMVYGALFAISLIIMVLVSGLLLGNVGSLLVVSGYLLIINAIFTKKLLTKWAVQFARLEV